MLSLLLPSRGENIIFWEPGEQTWQLCWPLWGASPELRGGRRVCPLAPEAVQLLFQTKEFLCSGQLFSKSFFAQFLFPVPNLV